jgi:hypothetical protein
MTADRATGTGYDCEYASAILLPAYGAKREESHEKYIVEVCKLLPSVNFNNFINFYYDILFICNM